ncbi:MAG: PaaI family thioesterase [Paracoccaceae bacterium]|nr:PaaI family thioesterase [Paracoccaceae bacterium]
MQNGTRGPKADEIAASFAAQGMMATLGAELVEAGAGRVVIAAPIRPEVGQQHGFAHAALAFALGDSAAGYAALSLMPDGAEVLTVEMKINLLAPAAGERLIATGEVVRAGRRISVVTAEVVAEADGHRRLVALLQGTMIPA